MRGDPSRESGSRSLFGSLVAYLRRNHLALIALFFAFTGGAIAVTRNSVGSRTIKNGGVKSIDVANDKTAGALTGRDIAKNSLGGGDINESSLSGLPKPDLIEFSQVTTQQHSDAAGPVDLATQGPSVTVQVSTGDLVMLFMAAEIRDNNAGGGQCTVYIRDSSADFSQGDPKLFPTGTTGFFYPLYSNHTFGGTNAIQGGVPVVIPASPGSHTYQMRYGGYPSLAESCDFKNRRLWVGVLR